MQATTNRYGDLIKELYEGIRDNNLPQTRVDRIQEIFNELSDREDKYNNWLLPGTGRMTAKQPLFTLPNWTTSPLSTLIVRRIEDVPISHETNTYISFDNQTSDDSDVFLWESSDAQKIQVKGVPSAPIFQVRGFITWTANSNGFRGAWLQAFDQDDNSLGTGPLHVLPGFANIDNVFPLSLCAIFGNLKYIKLYVYQNSSISLNLKDVYLSIGVG